nr:acyltransferase family protein [Akkermansiaceae bacterium]
MHHPERFHALDATRAFALLLGVVFHGAWFYALDPLGTGVKDVTANHFFGWFFHTSHTFRMQTFFLIAGFFARLVIQKRGVKSFARNRLIRIGIPLVVGWFILLPLLITVWVWGRNLSGQNPADVPPLLAGIGVVVSGAIFVERSDGGAFGWTHLWFLYYLLVFYLLTLAGRAVLLLTPVCGEPILGRLDRFIRFLTASPPGALVLVLVLTPAIWSMTSWLGIDTPGFSKTPVLKVTIAYLAFFLLGWFVHRQAHELGALFRQWKFYLGAGLLASV